MKVYLIMNIEQVRILVKRCEKKFCFFLASCADAIPET